jgi:hypothetical protein
MKLESTFTLLLFLFLASSYSQNCNGPIVLSSQNDIDNFQQCDTIFGDLIISGLDISSLSNLSGIKGVFGNIYIDGNQVLSSIDQFTDLCIVTGEMIISNNPSLINIEQFNNLKEIQNIIITANDVLMTVDGFQNIDSMITLAVVGNLSLPELTGFNSLSKLNEFIIQSNDNLVEISDFNNLTQVSGILDISGNLVLNQLGALQSVTNISILNFVFNLSVTSLSDLNNIVSADIINITDNALLVDLELTSMSSVTGDLTLVSNIQLANCCGIYDLLSQANVGGTVNISNNAPDCNSETEILTVCAPQSNPCDSSILFTTQLEIDNFPGCDTVFGSVEIAGADITDLSNLDNILHIDGDLLIHDNPSLQFLDNFTALKSTTGQIDIHHNDSIEYITNFQDIVEAKNVKIRANKSLTEMKLMPYLTDVRNIVVAGNRSLLYFGGFHSVNYLNGQLRIHNNRSLRQFEGFYDLANIKNHLKITRNDSLVKMGDFTNLKSIGKTLEISQNKQLIEFSTLYNVETALTVIINDNAALEHLKGLYSLIKCEDLTISNNPSLKQLDGLDQLQAVNSDLTIVDNSILNYCCAIYPLLDQSNVGGLVTIQGNDVDCDSEAIILQVCNPTPVPCSDAPDNLNSWNYYNYKIFEWDTAYGSNRCVVYGKGDNSTSWRYITGVNAQEPFWAYTRRNRFRNIFRGSNYVEWQVACRCQTNTGYTWSPWSQSDTIWNNGSYKTEPAGNQDIMTMLDEASFKVYPNPSSGLFTYEFNTFGESTADLNIYDFSVPRLPHPGPISDRPSK